MKILNGPRSEQSIIRDMVPAVCYSHVLYRQMSKHGENINAGDIVFRITVEYTGEVYRAEAIDTTIRSRKFVQRVSDIIMDTDFVGWARDETDTVFIYPVTFGR